MRATTVRRERRLGNVSAQARRQVVHDTPLRRARTCYGHLAGVAGVALFDQLTGRGWIEIVPSEAGRERPEVRLTTLGAAELTRRGVDTSSPEPSRRRFAYACIDWTEGRYHLAGALGERLLLALERDGLIARQRGDRAVTVARSLERWLSDGPRLDHSAQAMPGSGVATG